MKEGIKEIIHLDWSKLRIFYYIAQAGSFTKAAPQLNLEQSTLSRSIQGFEDSLGYPLFIRQKTGVTLTEEGRILLKATQDILSTLTLAESQIDNQRNVPRGLLRVAPIAGEFFHLYLSRHISHFLELYPDIRLAFFGTDTAPQLERLEADVLIYPFIEDRSDLIQNFLHSYSLGLYASPDYLKRFGFPQSTADLDQHRLIVSGTRHIHPFINANWVLSLGKESGQMRTPYLEENSDLGRMALAQSGLGIASLVMEMPNLKGSGLIPILPNSKGPTIDLYYTYSTILKDSKRVKVFWEYLSKVF